jgi:hypothetical protein
MLFVWVFLVSVVPELSAQDLRKTPLDLYLIVDVTENFQEDQEEIITWINEDVIDRLLQEGDRLIIWTVGDTTRIMHLEILDTDIVYGRQKINDLSIEGKNADFSTSLQEAASLYAQNMATGGRFSYMLLVSSSAEALASAMTGSSAALLRWFRVEKSSRWQALELAPGIGDRVRQAAAAFMRSR